MTKTAALPQLKAKGCTDADIAALEAKVGTIDWAALLALVAQYGPSIIAAILSLFGVTPAPTPTS
jgi:hypothetical protein